MINKDMIYIITLGVFAIYGIVVTVVVARLLKNIKRTQMVQEIKIQKNAQTISDANKNIESSVEKMEHDFDEYKKANDLKTGELFENALSATTLLVDEKTKNISEKLDNISERLSIIDCTIKGIENEKTFVKKLLMPAQPDSIEVEYKDIPKDGFLNNARKAVKNAAKAGTDIVKNLFIRKEDDEQDE